MKVDPARGHNHTSCQLGRQTSEKKAACPDLKHTRITMTVRRCGVESPPAASDAALASR
jgi:hypothetical protein